MWHGFSLPDGILIRNPDKNFTKYSHGCVTKYLLVKIPILHISHESVCVFLHSSSYSCNFRIIFVSSRSSIVADAASIGEAWLRMLTKKFHRVDGCNIVGDYTIRLYTPLHHVIPWYLLCATR